MKIKILEFLKPSWMKIIITVILVALAAVTIYLLMGIMVDCMFSWGCDTLSFGAFIANLLAVPLVYPAYFIYALPQMIFGEPHLPTNVMLAIMGVIEIIYLYLLSCIIALFAAKFIKRRKNKTIESNGEKHPWSARTTNLVIFIPLAIIIFFDGLAFPRRFGYLLELLNGASFYITNFLNALKIIILSVFEIWYLAFLFLRRKKIAWNKIVLLVIWFVVLVLLALNIIVLMFSFFHF